MSFQRTASEATPQIVVTDKTRASIEFRLFNVSRHFANALRRVMIAEIPTLAIETVEIGQNTSTLPDEYIAHRLGLIPFCSEHANDFSYMMECDCDGGCPKCQVKYVLDVTCPQGETYTVTTNDLKLCNPSFENGASGMGPARYHSEVKPVSLFTQKDNGEPEPILIAKLGAGQQLQFAAYVQKGIGRVHSKWSPVCVSAYHQIAEIRFRDNLMQSMTRKEKTQLVESCPLHVFMLGHDENVKIGKIEDCIFCNQCIREIETFGKKDAVVIQSKRGVFVFNVETVGSLSPESVVKNGFQVLAKKLEKFEQNVEKSV